jgi:hypothetical protein
MFNRPDIVYFFNVYRGLKHDYKRKNIEFEPKYSDFPKIFDEKRNYLIEILKNVYEIKENELSNFTTEIPEHIKIYCINSRKDPVINYKVNQRIKREIFKNRKYKDIIYEEASHCSDLTNIKRLKKIVKD